MSYKHELLKYLEGQQAKGEAVVVKISKSASSTGKWKQYSNYKFDSKQLINLNAEKPIEIPLDQILEFGKTDDYFRRKSRKTNKSAKKVALARDKILGPNVKLSSKLIKGSRKDSYVPSIKDINTSKVDNTSIREQAGGDITGYGRKKTKEFSNTIKYIENLRNRKAAPTENITVHVTTENSQSSDVYEMLRSSAKIKSIEKNLRSLNDCFKYVNNTIGREVEFKEYKKMKKVFRYPKNGEFSTRGGLNIKIFNVEISEVHHSKFIVLIRYK